MPEILLCDGRGCPLRQYCARYQAQCGKDKLRHSYYSDKTQACAFFIDERQQDQDEDDE